MQKNKPFEENNNTGTKLGEHIVILGPNREWENKMATALQEKLLDMFDEKGN
jgi:hypothetical protein